MASEDGSPLPEGKGAGGEGPWAGLAIIIGAAFVHALWLGWALEDLSPRAEWRDHGLSTTVWAAWTCALIAATIAYVSSFRHRGATQAARRAPVAAAIGLVAGVGGAMPLSFGSELLTEDFNTALVSLITMLVPSSMMLGLFVWQWLPRRSRVDSPELSFRPPPTLSLSFGLQIGAAGLAGAMFAGGVLTLEGSIERVGVGQALWAGAVLGSLVAAAVIAGVSIGLSPGRDVVAIAGRLDALGYNAGRPVGSRVVVTSFDELGLLFRALEQLRTHLHGEVATYQAALNRTRNAERSRAAFLAAVSHELRTPLNSIIGSAQLMLEGFAGELSEAQEEDVRLIRTGGYQLLGLINDILDISMLKSGKLELRLEKTELRTLIGEISSIHRPLVTARELSLRLDLPEHLPEIRCDRRRVGQVITNLLSNAIKFTLEGEVVIRVSLDPTREELVLRVIDTGIGIAENKLGTVFEEFGQAGSRERQLKGTGLGLAISRSIAEHHGGSLTVTSKLDEGSTFTLTLPFAGPSEGSKTLSAEEARHG